MPDIVNVQFTEANAYLTELIQQFARLDKRIEGGETVTLNLTEGDSAIALVVSREKVVKRLTPTDPSATRKAHTLADNNSLIAGLTKTFTFDLGEANRNITSADVQMQVRGATNRKRMPGAERLMAELPNPAVT